MRLVKFFSALLLVSSFNAHALPSDSSQPIRVQADSAEFDEGKGVAVYQGDVIITQGSLQITGSTVTVTQTSNGEIDVFTATGNPASYQQQPSAGKELIKAYARSIQYFAGSERIILIDQAKIIQEGNTFIGEKIVYDTRRQIVNAGRATGTAVSTPQPRIDMIIKPKAKPTEQQTP